MLKAKPNSCNNYDMQIELGGDQDIDFETKADCCMTKQMFVMFIWQDLVRSPKKSSDSFKSATKRSTAALHCPAKPFLD